MSDVEIIRELHCYKRMYNLLQKTITSCINESRDLVVREKLIKAQQGAEDIYTGEIYDYKELNSDERAILALLKIIIETEIDRVPDGDMRIVEACIDWSLTIQNIKMRVSEDFVKEQVKKIFAKSDEEEDSEQ